MGILAKLYKILHPFEDSITDMNQNEKQNEMLALIKLWQKQRGNSVNNSNIVKEIEFISEDTEYLSNEVESKLRIKAIIPSGYINSVEVVDRLKKGESVVIMTKGMDRDEMRRLIDYISGATYMAGGSLKSIGYNVYLAIPRYVENIDDFIADGVIQDKLELALVGD